jgi:hypothetical protein
MNLLTARAILQRRFAWLLWLAMLLPMAQMAAMSHSYSHANQEGSTQADGKQALVHTHCDLCASAAALIAGAAPLTPPGVPQVAARHEVPADRSGDVWPSYFVSAYQSRAPPFALR